MNSYQIKVEATQKRLKQLTIDSVNTWAKNENTSTVMRDNNKTMIVTKFKYDCNCCTFDIFCCTVL